MYTKRYDDDEYNKPENIYIYICDTESMVTCDKRGVTRDATVLMYGGQWQAVHKLKVNDILYDCSKIASLSVIDHTNCTLCTVTSIDEAFVPLDIVPSHPVKITRGTAYERPIDCALRVRLVDHVSLYDIGTDTGHDVIINGVRCQSNRHN